MTSWLCKPPTSSAVRLISTSDTIRSHFANKRRQVVHDGAQTLLAATQRLLHPLAFANIAQNAGEIAFSPDEIFADRDIEVNELPILVPTFDLAAHADVMQALYFQR